ncbi:MAG: methylmalonyl Co-A mutase-associated GTPase MeaB [Polyangiales bacterium]
MATDPSSADELAARVRAREPRAVARALRVVDDRTSSALPLLKSLYPHTGRAFVLGVTGTPGAGKSTLVDRLITAFRATGKTVAVVAVDPTSPFSGGAILGDRIRMQRHFLDEGVFIRSLATRGYLGGLSRSASDVIHVLDAAGYDVVLVETVGVGQDELDVARLAHTTLVVVPPGLGDDIQAIKAGILEVANIFVVNKADRDGADATVRDLEQMIALGEQLVAAGAKTVGHSAAMTRAMRTADAAPGQWAVPVLKTVASRGEGIDALLDSVERHRAHLEGTTEGKAAEARRVRAEFDAVLRDVIFERAFERMGDALDAEQRGVESRASDPYSAAERLVRRAFEGGA